MYLNPYSNISLRLSHLSAFVVDFAFLNHATAVYALTGRSKQLALSLSPRNSPFSSSLTIDSFYSSRLFFTSFRYSFTIPPFVLPSFPSHTRPTITSHTRQCVPPPRTCHPPILSLTVAKSYQLRHLSAPFKSSCMGTLKESWNAAPHDPSVFICQSLHGHYPIGPAGQLSCLTF